MTWFKVDDNLHSHLKAIAAGNSAMGLWVRAGSWCGDHLTDGFVPKSVARSLGNPREIRGLIDAGLWTEVEGGYAFHEWEQRQPSREEVQAERAKTAERVRRFRQRRNAGRNDVTNGVGNAPSHDPGPEPNRGKVAHDHDLDGSTRHSPVDNVDTAGQGIAHAPGNDVTNVVGSNVGTASPSPSLDFSSSVVSHSPDVPRASQNDDRLDLDKIATALDADHAWAERVATDVLARGNGHVAQPTRYVLAAIASEPERYRPTKSPPRLADLCRHALPAPCPVCAEESRP